MMSWAIGNPHYFEAVFQPYLREIGATALLRRRGIDIDRRPDAAAAVLGDELWRLIDGETPSPDAANDAGARSRRIADFLVGLERL